MSVITHRQNLLAIATAYGKATDQSLGQVSKKFYGSWNWIRYFVDGKTTISIDKYYSMIDAFTEQWPDGAPWPSLRAVVIARPKAKESLVHKENSPRALP